MQENNVAEPSPTNIAGTTANSGQPILVPQLTMDGVCGSDALPGQTVTLITKLAITSDSPSFYPIAQGLSELLTPYTGVRLHRAEYVLVVVKEDRSAQIWLDTAAVSQNIVMKRPAQFGTVIFSRDIVDIQGMTFPCVEIGPKDQVIVLFREQWRFALYFDFNPERNLDPQDFARNLGTLFRSLAYRNQYDLMADPDARTKLIKTGWFPFAEIAQSDFGELARCIRLGGDLEAAEETVVKRFTRDRLEQILTRWNGKPTFAKKSAIFTSGIEAFLREDPVSSIKTILTEIEGVLNSEHEARHGRRLWRVEPLLDFAVASAQTKAGSPNTLLFPQEFKEYLQSNTFANFDPRQTGSGEASSRHAVGHGAAEPESYTMARALQAILTLDQLLFYL